MPTTHACELSALIDTVQQSDYLDLLARIPDDSVDLLLSDPPYAATRNNWDVPFDLDAFWRETKRVVKINGAIVVTANMRFATQLVSSNSDMFRQDLVWKKTIGSGQLNINHQPLQIHEHVLIFYRRRPVYNEQLTVGTPYTMTRKPPAENKNYGPQTQVRVVNHGTRRPTTVLEIANPRLKGQHPTQKPVALFERLIKTYTNPGDLVVDPFAGSGTTAVAAINTKRRFIIGDSDADYVDMARQRIAAAS
jgi:site-specific DNA-methyltransferase (adenine-specific)